eukprot:GHUV01022304.1.p1 GENE.GHUV01022304.1~~GHUV01022304.1.p1  ORF type:complete len:173 (-),score=39.59 GHUV01022304.1:625-1143(-)
MLPTAGLQAVSLGTKQYSLAASTSVHLLHSSLCAVLLLQVPAVLEYNIHPPPVPEGKGNALTFVSLRLATYPSSGCSIPEHLQRRFLEVFAVQVQQFKGYMFQTCSDSLREVRPDCAWQQVAVHWTHFLDMCCSWSQGSSPIQDRIRHTLALCTPLQFGAELRWHTAAACCM